MKFIRFIGLIGFISLIAVTVSAQMAPPGGIPFEPYTPPDATGRRSGEPPAGSMPPPPAGGGYYPPAPPASGSGQSSGSGSGGGEDEGEDEWWRNYFNNGDYEEAFDFIKKVEKKKVKKPYQISVFGKILSILKRPFDPATLLGAKWKINNANPAEPVVQGSFVGKGSYVNIAVGFYTGTVRAALQGKESWNVLYVNRGAAQVAELFWKGGGYQREVVADEEGNPHQTVLFAEGEALFATTPEGAFFAVKPGAFPAVLKEQAVRVPVPRGGIRIPVEKILEMLAQGVAPKVFAAMAKPVGEQVADYGKIRDGMERLQAEYNALNFEDSDFYYDAVQKLVDRYDFLERSLAFVAASMKQFRIFVRDAEWFESGSPAAYVLLKQGIAPTLAALLAQGAPSFDFYLMQGKGEVFAGFCREGGACGARRMSAKEKDAARVKTAIEGSYPAVITADQKVNGIEEALFGVSEN